jgi:hypothetical protein
MENSLYESRRRHMRLKLQSAFGEISIQRIRASVIQSRSKPIVILDLSPGGLRFQTDLYFPVTPNITLLFKAKIVNNITIELDGRIMWRKLQDNMFVYGFEFTITDAHRILLTRVLNDLLLELSPQQNQIHKLYRLYNNKRRMKSKDGTE